LLSALAGLSAVTCAANIDLTIRIARCVGPENEYEDPLTASSWAFPTWVYGSLVISIAVTSILSVSLWRAKTGLNGVDRTLKHIIGITWESAALPCLSFILGAALYSRKSIRESTHVRHIDSFFVLAAAKLYTLGILRTLNARKAFRERLASTADDPSYGRHSLSGFQWDQATADPPDSTGTITRPQLVYRGQFAHSISPFSPGPNHETGEDTAQTANAFIPITSALREPAADPFCDFRDDCIPSNSDKQC